jgi:asparagine synthase (glutamine-hydrolysing)
MFAFVIWDEREQRLFAARDRMGIKPLYYALSDRTLLCGSEIKALFASRWCTPQLDLKAVPEHLTLGYLAGERTLFCGVDKLLPGHRLIWKDGEVKTEQYWDIPLPDAATQNGNEADLVCQFLQLFRESVQSHLMSDVPLGVFLSGGLDSSAIAATMAETMSEPVKTFSVGFESEYYSEFDFAREVASCIGADHHEVVLKPEHMLASLPKSIWHEDEPIRNASSVALAEVANLARSQVKVVLTGEGSDELFAGYERYWATLFNVRWGAVYQRVAPRWVREKLIRQTIWRWPLPLSVKKKISHTFLNYTLRPEEIVFENWHATFSPRDYPQLLSAEACQALKDVDPYADTMQLYERRPKGDVLDRMLYTDQKAYLVELLRKQDTMSMAASIESRVPFLDHKIVEFAAQVPAKFKIRRFNGKHLVKRAMRQILPDAIINRKKMGFPVPISQWFRGKSVASIRGVLMSEPTRQHGIFNMEYLARLVDDHVRGDRDNSEAIWTVLNFELWTRIVIDGQSCTSVADELVEWVERSPQACLAGVA